MPLQVLATGIHRKSFCWMCQAMSVYILSLRYTFYHSEVFSSTFQKDFGLKRLDFGSNLPLPHPQERTTNHEFWKLRQNGIHLA